MFLKFSQFIWLALGEKEPHGKLCEHEKPG